MPALDDLRAAHAEAEDEPPARHRIEAHRSHRDERGRARAGLHDAGAEADARGARGDERQRGRRVVTPRFGGPHVVDAEPLRLDGIGGRLVPVVVGEPQGHGEPHQAGRGAVNAVTIF